MPRYVPSWEVLVRKRSIETHSHRVNDVVKCEQCATILHTCDESCFSAHHESLDVDNFMLSDCAQALSPQPAEPCGSGDTSSAPQTSASGHLKKTKRGTRAGKRKREAMEKRTEEPDRRLFYSSVGPSPLCCSCVRLLGLNSGSGFWTANPVHPVYVKEYAYLKSRAMFAKLCHYGDRCKFVTCGYRHLTRKVMNINELPEEVIRCILGYCGTTDLLIHVGSVCCLWRDLAREVFMAGSGRTYSRSSVGAQVPPGGPFFKDEDKEEHPRVPYDRMSASLHKDEKKMTRIERRLEKQVLDREAIWKKLKNRELTCDAGAKYFNEDFRCAKNLAATWEELQTHWASLGSQKYKLGCLPVRQCQ